MEGCGWILDRDLEEYIEEVLRFKTKEERTVKEEGEPVQ